MRTLLLTFAATLLCAGAYAADPELYCADLTYDGFTTRSYTFATRGDRTLVLEIDLPERGDAGGPRPFVVYVPGGSWRTCGIGAFRRQSAYLVSQGIAGVRIVYSLGRRRGRFQRGIGGVAGGPRPRGGTRRRTGAGYAAVRLRRGVGRNAAGGRRGAVAGRLPFFRGIQRDLRPDAPDRRLAFSGRGDALSGALLRRGAAGLFARESDWSRSARRRAVPRPGRPHDLVEAVAAVLRCGSCGGRTCPRSFSTTTPATASSITGSPTTTRRSPARRRRSSSPCWASRRGVSGWRMVERACGFRKPFSSSVREGYSSGLSPLFFAARWRMIPTMRLSSCPFRKRAGGFRRVVSGKIRSKLTIF